LDARKHDDLMQKGNLKWQERKGDQGDENC
jgi:hypothetical protein